MDGGMLSQDEISALLNGMSDGSADAADRSRCQCARASGFGVGCL